VFVGRFIGLGRIAVAWMAGAGRMPWRRFVTWNAAACVIWATLIGGVTYLVGSGGARWIAIAGIAVAGGLVMRIAWSRRRRLTPGS
jgi:membrane-associated protein